VATIKLLEKVLPRDISTESRELVDIALTASGRMQRLVDSMLEISRMQAGKSELNLSVVDLEALVRRVTDTVLRPYCNDIHYTVTIPPDLPYIEADRDRLERVLVNMLDNAIKHSPSQGSISVDVWLVESALQVRVTDAGPGIPIEERQRIFERFAQVAGEKGKRRGFGLGLSYCKLALEAHGGAIWVESAPEGSGSCFVFQLPLRR
jgi:signal transduction histidine kinase